MSFVLLAGVMGAGAAAGGTVSLLFPSHPYAVGESVSFRVLYTLLGVSMAVGSVYVISDPESVGESTDSEKNERG